MRSTTEQPRHDPSGRRRPARFTTAAALSMALLAAGCGSGGSGSARTVENFCATYSSEKAQFTGKYAPIEKSNSGNALSNLLLGIQSLGDVKVILTKLDKVAPDDIEPDVAEVLDSWKKMQDTLGDEAGNALNPGGLIGAMLKGLIASIQSQGSWERVGSYVTKNCGANA